MKYEKYHNDSFNSIATNVQNWKLGYRNYVCIVYFR